MLRFITMNTRVNKFPQTGDKKMILYYSYPQDDLAYGGSVIRKRNLALLQKMAGEDEVGGQSVPGTGCGRRAL